jgi:hypothetical protein
MFQDYRFKLISTACVAGAVISYAVGGTLGVLTGYFGGGTFVYLNDPVRKNFKTDAERILESLRTSEEIKQLYRRILQAMLLGLALGLALVLILPASYGAPLATVLAMLATGILVTRIS